MIEKVLLNNRKKNHFLFCYANPCFSVNKETQKASSRAVYSRGKITKTYS